MLPEVPLPPLPLIPASNTERLAWVRWATEAVLAERERCARKIVEHGSSMEASGDPENYAAFLAAAIRKGE